jgi:DnaJ domain
MDYKKCYEILGLKESATLEEIRKAYKKLSLLRHPDKVLKCTNTKPGEKTFINCGSMYEKKDKSKERFFCKTEHKILYENATKELQKINEAHEKLKNLKEGGGGSDPDEGQEPCHNEANGCKNKCDNNWTNHHKLAEENIVINMYEDGGKWKKSRGWPNNFFFFCSQNCLNQFKNNSLFLCQKCRDVCWVKKVTKNIKNSLSYCPKCFESINGTPGGRGNKKVPRPGGGNCPGEYCSGVREATSWRQGGSRNKWYCESCWGDIFGKKEDEYIQKIKALDKLTEEEKQDFISQIHNSPSSKFEHIWQQAKEKNDSREGGSKNLQSEIQKAIQEIEAELNKEPKITTEDDEWKIYIETSPTLAILQSRKQKVLDDIQEIREKKGGNSNLTELRLRAIHLIKRELEKNSISNSELPNPNWEKDLNQARTKDAILNIQNQVLANIKNIKAVVEEKNLLQELLIQAQQEENWNNYQNLENILKQIKKLRSSNAYQEKVEEVRAIENRLRELNPTQFEETALNSLNQQVKDEGLNEGNMDEETKTALAVAKQNPTLENLAMAEEKVHQNGADNKIKDLVTQTWNKLKKGNLTNEEKKKLEREIITLLASENKYQKQACQKHKHEINVLLAELRGEKSQNDTENPFWKKPLASLLIISLLGILITGVLIWRRNQRRIMRR